MIKLRYEAFWPGFNPNDFFITKYFNEYILVNDNSYDLLVCSVFPKYIFSTNNTGKILIFNGEHPSYIINFILNTGIKPDIFMGFTDIEKNVLRQIYGDNLPFNLYYPLWILYYDKEFSQEYFDKKNKEIENISKDNFINRNYCCLINSHDNNNSRKPIYNFLINNNKKIDCPGKLLNNMDPKLVGSSSEDKLNFMKNYKFNICSENKYGMGYLTEKLPQCMDSTCIPIYVGCDDESKINFKIFNKERVIFIKDNNFSQLSDIINNDDITYELFKKPIFNENSFQILSKYMKTIRELLINKLNN